MNQYEAYSEIKICEVLHSKVIYNYISILLVFLLQKGMRCDTCETRNERQMWPKSKVEGIFSEGGNARRVDFASRQGRKAKKAERAVSVFASLGYKKSTRLQTLRCDWVSQSRNLYGFHFAL